MRMGGRDPAWEADGPSVCLSCSKAEEDQDIQMTNENQVVTTSRRKPSTADPGRWHFSALRIPVRGSVWAERKQASESIGLALPAQHLFLSGNLFQSNKQLLAACLPCDQEGRARHTGKPGKGTKKRTSWDRWHLIWVLKDV